MLGPSLGIWTTRPMPALLVHWTQWRFTMVWSQGLRPHIDCHGPCLPPCLPVSLPHDVTL